MHDIRVKMKKQKKHINSFYTSGQLPSVTMLRNLLNHQWTGIKEVVRTHGIPLNTMFDAETQDSLISYGKVYMKIWEPI